MSKLPSDVRIQIARNTTKDVWDIRELLDVIQKEVEAREVCENIKTHSDNPNKKPNVPVPRGLGSASALLASGSGVTNQFSIRCAFCQKPHYSASCEDVCDVNKRKEILKRDGRCFVCLRKGHITKQCDKRCRKSQGLHHQLINMQRSRSSKGTFEETRDSQEPCRSRPSRTNSGDINSKPAFNNSWEEGTPTDCNDVCL
jgi:hypothetical protein